MNTCDALTRLAQFRQAVYQHFDLRADTLMDLVDALSSAQGVRTVVELSLQPCFRRGYSALFKGVAAYAWDERTLAHLAAPVLPAPTVRPFWLLGVDVTSQPRLYARTLRDRSFVYQPTVIVGQKPITIGHQYSVVALLPGRPHRTSAVWVVPLASHRVASHADKELVGAAQLATLLTDPALPFHDQLCVEVADSSYSKPAYLHANRQHHQLVSVVRLRGCRTVYHAPPPPPGPRTTGHPRWYGAPMALGAPTTWAPPDVTVTTRYTSARGHTYRVELQAWYDMRLRGQRKPARLPLHEHPFTLVRCVLYGADDQPVFRQTLWLAVLGPRRRELTLEAIWQAYGDRFDLEHCFRFGKQRLLLSAAQTPVDTREEAWWQLSCLAYLQLWAAAPVAQSCPRPWERYLPVQHAEQVTPSQVQRDFGRIIWQFGTPALPPKPRGNAPGRPRGTRLPPRLRYAVVRKGAKTLEPP
jgi:hypothetical protein